MFPSASVVGAEGRGYSNVVLWAVFAGVSVLVGGWFIHGVHRVLTWDALLAGIALAVRTAGYVALGLLVEALLLHPWSGRPWAKRCRRIALHGFWIVMMAVTVALAMDVFVFAFAGYHLTTGIRILFADGLDGVGSVVGASGLPPGWVVGGVVTLAAGLALAVVLSRYSERWSGAWRWSITWWDACKAALLATGLLAVVDTAGYRFRDPFLWELENRRVPLAFSIVRSEAALASFRVALNPPAPVPAAPPVTTSPPSELPDIYLIIIESLRRDLLDAAVMPNFARFAAESWTFDHPVTTGNVTHYSWYGLLCAKYPIYYDVAKEDPTQQGSVPLAMLRSLGYQTHLLATPDTAYQQLGTVIFGPGDRLLTSQYKPSAKLPPDRDRMVVDRLIQRFGTTPPGGHFHLVALDSTHFEYGWGEGFQPPFTPYAASTSVIKNYQKDRHARAAVFNRYKNSAAWVDFQLGRFLDALRADGRLERSIVIITGDHGESFWESREGTNGSGVGTHGSELCPEQLEVAFAMRFPNQAPARFPGVFSLLDVMPTVLAQLGAAPGPEAGLAGRPYQTRIANPATPDPGFALTFQGWNERAFRFALTDGTKRVILELDRSDPLDCRRLAVKDVALGQGAATLAEQGDAAAYRALLADLPRLIDRLPFLRFD